MAINATTSQHLPTSTIPHSTAIDPDEWFYWFAVVLVGSCPRDRGPCGECPDSSGIFMGEVVLGIMDNSPESQLTVTPLQDDLS